MTTYYITILLVIIFGLIADSHVYCYEDEGNKIRYGIQKRYIIPLFFIFLIVGGFRFYVGTDFHTYYTGFQASWDEIKVLFKTLDEPLTWTVTYLSRKICNVNQFVIFVENAIIVFCLFKGFREHDADEYLMPLLLYMFYGGWLMSFNAVRQAIAVTLVFAFSKKDGKYWLIKYVVIVAIAFLFHKSALFMLPILIIANRKNDVFQVFGIIAMVFIVNKFGGSFYSYMGATETLVGTYSTQRLNILRVLVSLVPVLLITFAYVAKETEFIDDNRFLVNLTLINAILVLLTKNSAYMNRMTYYTVIYSIILIPKLRRVFPQNFWQLYNIITCVLFMVFFRFEVGSELYRWCF